MIGHARAISWKLSSTGYEGMISGKNKWVVIREWFCETMWMSKFQKPILLEMWMSDYQKKISWKVCMSGYERMISWKVWMSGYKTYFAQKLWMIGYKRMIL